MAKKCMCRCSLWGERFWNNFFHPRHPGVYLVLLHLVLTILFTICYITFAFLFETFSALHANAFLIIFVSNLTLVIMSILVLHFLTLTSDSLTVIRCGMLYLGMLLSLVFGAVAIAQFWTKPSNHEIKTFVTKFFDGHHRVPRIMDTLHQQRRCCGVDGIKDFVDFPQKIVHIKRLPDSCCFKKKYRRGCGELRGPGLNEYVHRDDLANQTNFMTEGCFLHKKTFANLEKLSPDAYSQHYMIANCIFINPILIVWLIAIYSYYICFKLPREDEQPPWVQDEFKEKVRRLASFQCFSNAGLGRKPSKNGEFVKMHTQIRSSLKHLDEMFDGTSTPNTVGSSSVGGSLADSEIPLNSVGSSTFETVETLELKGKNLGQLEDQNPLGSAQGQGAPVVRLGHEHHVT